MNINFTYGKDNKVSLITYLDDIIINKLSKLNMSIFILIITLLFYLSQDGYQVQNDAMELIAKQGLTLTPIRSNTAVLG